MLVLPLEIYSIYCYCVPLGNDIAIKEVGAAPPWKCKSQKAVSTGSFLETFKPLKVSGGPAVERRLLKHDWGVHQGLFLAGFSTGLLILTSDADSFYSCV